MNIKRNYFNMQLFFEDIFDWFENDDKSRVF